MMSQDIEVWCIAGAIKYKIHIENVNLENYNMNKEIGNMDFNPINLVNQLLNNRN